MLLFFKHYDLSEHQAIDAIKKALKFTSSDYDIVLSQSVVVIKHTIFSALWSAALYSSRAAVFVLYAYTMPESSATLISCLLFLSCLIRSIWNLLISYLCDRLGYDKTFTLLAIIDIFGVLLQTTAPDFWILSIGYLLMPSSMFLVTWSYCSWILPYQYSIKYCKVTNGGRMFLLVIGPLFAGVIADTLGYRSVFCLNFVILIGQLVYTIEFIHGTQTLIEEEQKIMEIISYPDDYAQFPVLINKHNARYHTENNKQFWSSFFRLSKVDRAILTLITFSNRLLWTYELVLLTFYSPYILIRYNTTIVTATAQLSVLGFGLGIGNVLVPRVMHNFDSLYVRFSIMFFSGLIEILWTGYLFPNNSSDINILWIYVFVFGLCVGLHTMSLESIILAVQPKDGIAQMAAVRSVLINILKAFSLLSIGLLSKYYTIEWLWYILCILFGLSFVTAIMAIILRKIS